MDEKLKYDTQLGEARLGFCLHLSLFFAIGTLLIVINLHFSPERFWALWPVSLWLIFVLWHAWRTRKLKRRRDVHHRYVDHELFNKDLRSV